ncbi:hypothetical protein H9Q13_11605 [Pontibacter sp. JH31]|uniref:Uncharacterized protein n=1 Tax=Pontibacter aquaedesilientis TaxID=2766980 RepID=A0ABR7XK98_9BACT|nr:hypothetical protein [Pontibacter aquaedesilientis]MBD1397811.1 hypothetical protein [Pontibacter aquaedesilientis]
MSSLILIPWIIYGFKNPEKNTLGLNQSKLSLILLIAFEVLYFAILVGLLGERNPEIAGSGSFGWMYYLVYEKGIFPIFMIAELIEPVLGDKVDNYPILYFITALLMDYIILKIISPKTIYYFERNPSANKS